MSSTHSLLSLTTRLAPTIVVVVEDYNHCINCSKSMCTKPSSQTEAQSQTTERTDQRSHPITTSRFTAFQIKSSQERTHRITALHPSTPPHIHASIHLVGKVLVCDERERRRSSKASTKQQQTSIAKHLWKFVPLFPCLPVDQTITIVTTQSTPTIVNNKHVHHHHRC